LLASAQYVFPYLLYISSQSPILTHKSQGGSLAVRGGLRAMRNSAIGCAVLLAVIEGVGIGFQRMMAEGTALTPPVAPEPAPIESGGGGKVFL
jgi:hypothetical protein